MLHEVINFLQRDNGENYIDALPHGGVSKIRDNKIKYILLTSAMEAGKLEILAKAEVEKQIRLNGDNFKKRVINKSIINIKMFLDIL